MSFVDVDVHGKVSRVYAYTADTVADLPIPTKSPAWAVTGDGHVCAWGGSSWTTDSGNTGATGPIGATGASGASGA